MRRLVYALSLSTLFFAVCTLYLARELYHVRASGEATPVSAAAMAPASTTPPPSLAASVEKTEPAPRNTAAAAAASASASASSSAPTATTPARKYEAVTTVSQASPDAGKMLERIQDPVQRAAMHEERKNMYRMSHPGLADYLHMDEAEFERFIDVLARNDLTMQEAGLRCHIDKTCGTRGIDRGLMNAQKQEISDLFGPQTMEAFHFYQRTSSERHTVSELRGRLPDKYRLMDTQSDALVTAFHEERQRIQKDMQQRGIQLSSFNNLIYTPEPGADPGDPTVLAAEQYNRMLRDRASTVLTPEQVSFFERIQNEAMQSFRSLELHRRMN